VHWWAVVQDDTVHDGKVLPRGALVNYREWYGASKPNVGLKMTADEVAKGIVAREKIDGKREKVAYGVLDPAAFAVINGPSIAETMLRNGVAFRRADNTRVSRMKRAGGWNEVRSRLKGDGDGRPMVYFFDHCRDLIRTVPMMVHNSIEPEDLDTDSDDHAVDSFRYAMMSRPYRQRDVLMEDKNPFLVANAFKLKGLK
jgi:hypothetical protein